MRLSTLSLALLCMASAFAQPGILTRNLLIQYTPEWKGERFPDGRPKVPDGILKRMKSVTLEEAWAQLRTAGFNHQYEDGWYCIHPDKVLVGRALTAQWLPGRPDIQKVIEEQGRRTPHRRSECLAGRHATARRCLRLRLLRAEAGRSATTWAMRFTPGAITASSTTAPSATSMA